ncbi:Golgi SNAP receptor complex member 1-1-like isoform X4 [Lycium barbarum]|uniref:Golgi SNAP receptor complex member 1-1-like isoform X4 n=1 Tax=Lycium barbarum TaxID=112863 RepID=UPI00293E11FD|nr:Golgi SNAP receptor complex member 1-1-like isoform X4 [Lycium barbarum]
MDPPTSWDSLRNQVSYLFRFFSSFLLDHLIPTSWDSLRNQARKLEAQLDEQMHLYRKVVSLKVDSANDNDLESSINQLLKQLQQVNSQMQAWVSSGGSEIFSHTLTRHQEILQDLFEMDGVISHAQETMKALVFQRSTFGGINSKLSNVASRLPTVNHILSAIKKKKSMDTIIFSLVASVCMFLILIYWFTR